MTYLLLGAEGFGDTADRVHAHVLFGPDQPRPFKNRFWSAAGPGAIALLADSDLLGRGSVDIETISFVQSSDKIAYEPHGPVGRAEGETTGAFNVIQIADDVTFSATLGQQLKDAVPPWPIITNMYVLTFTMGRADFPVTDVTPRVT
ncbi:hypothetical protein [Conyzicola sp.]|uniref:hypothetical protein n=1 Tax=Conyzicola sp. TaxID=1969404 RepID=UPI00398A10E2